MIENKISKEIINVYKVVIYKSKRQYVSTSYAITFENKFIKLYKHKSITRADYNSKYGIFCFDSIKNAIKFVNKNNANTWKYKIFLAEGIAMDEQHNYCMDIKSFFNEPTWRMQTGTIEMKYIKPIRIVKI